MGRAAWLAGRTGQPLSAPRVSGSFCSGKGRLAPGAVGGGVAAPRPGVDLLGCASEAPARGRVFPVKLSVSSFSSGATSVLRFQPLVALTNIFLANHVCSFLKMLLI